MVTKKKKNTSHDLIVVGIGASAGGLEPLQMIFAHLPRELDHVAIIVAQHLSPDYKSMLAELLGRKTSVPVKHLVGRVPVEENTIYIAPPNADVTIDNGEFHLTKPVEGGAHPSVDVLFTSLAKEYGSHACGIVLSGTGKDGTKGILALNRVGAKTIVQDPVTAKYDGMPKSAIDTSIIDHILSAERIGSDFTTLISPDHDSSETIKDFSQAGSSYFLQIFNLLEKRIGVDFSDYKTSTLSRRLQKRITERKFDNEQEYLDYVRQNPEELNRLFEELLIGVTSFFRDPYVFKTIERILEKVMMAKKPSESFRIWIAGCATGEEAYTYAILIHEILQRSGKILPIQIFATDIDIKALHSARLGIYPAAAIATVPKGLLTKYFIKVNETTYELNKEVRKMVLFSRHDVTSNPPFLRLDVISCRNLLIYFNTELQKKVLPLFYYALNPHGYLILGKSENIGTFDTLFKTTSASLKIFQRKPQEGKSVKFPQFRPTKPRQIVLAEDEIPRESMTIADMVKETLYTSFDHPYIVIDENMEIVEVHGDLSAYLKFKEGTASLNLMKLIIPQLQIEARVVIGKALASKKPEIGTIRKITLQRKSAFVELRVKPLVYAKSNNPYFIVVFETINLDDKLFTVKAGGVEEKESARMIELEQELDATKEHMNSLVEELETSNEELQALNEEMQASNEELQASNEELETSNEELQATNEELENAYTELREANKEISQQKEEIERSAQNLDTLLNNTLIGFILVDRDYHVITCNKTASTLYQTLFKAELHEGVSFIKALPNSIFPAFHQSFKQALEGKQVVAEEAINAKNDQTVFLDFNYTPVKLEEDEKEARIVAISFVDITTRKVAELELLHLNEQLSQEKQFIETLAESLPSIVWTTDKDGKYLYCNQQFLIYTGTTFDEIRELTWKPFIHSADWQKTSQLWKKSLKTGEKFAIEHRIKNKDGQYRWHLTLATPIKNPHGSSRIWVGTSTDVHEQKILDERKNEFISIASHELKTPVTSIKGYAQVLSLLLKRNDTEKLTSTVNKMDSQLDRLTDLINDLLDVSRIETGKLHFTEKEFVFDQLVDEVLDSMQLMADHHVIEYSGQTKKMVLSDRDRLEQVMINLISNAIKYSPDAKKVMVKSQLNHKNIIFSVQDFGMGIPQDKQDKIFSRFYRVNGRGAETLPGMGLGLYISSEIVHRLGGKIWFESEEGKGSTFYFTVPLKKE